jgi:4-hydroxy-tetrahydrodipicolinate synthase
VGDRLVLLSGEDMTAVGFNAMGGRGVISVISNLVPKLAAEVQNLSLAGNIAQANRLQNTLVPLTHAMFAETSPMPVKYAASLMKKSLPDLRLPLVAPSLATQEAVRAAMATLALI